MNKVLPEAVKQRTWSILKEGFHPSTLILQQETPSWTVLHHFKGRKKSQYIMGWDVDYLVFCLLYIDNYSLRGKYDFWLQKHNQHFHLLTALARTAGVQTQYSCTVPHRAPHLSQSPHCKSRHHQSPASWQCSFVQILRYSLAVLCPHK